jgi:hypothetical protein
VPRSDSHAAAVRPGERPRAARAAAAAAPPLRLPVPLSESSVGVRVVSPTLSESASVEHCGARSPQISEFGLCRRCFPRMEAGRALQEGPRNQSAKTENAGRRRPSRSRCRRGLETLRDSHCGTAADHPGESILRRTPCADSDCGCAFVGRPGRPGCSVRVADGGPLDRPSPSPPALLAAAAVFTLSSPARPLSRRVVPVTRGALGPPRPPRGGGRASSAFRSPSAVPVLERCRYPFQVLSLCLEDWNRDYRVRHSVRVTVRVIRLPVLKS